MYQMIGDILQVILHKNPPTNMNDTNQSIDNILVTYMYDMYCIVNAIIGTSPSALVYNRNMIIDVLSIANLATIRDSRQHLIGKNLIR